MNIKPEISQILAVYLFLFIFGYGYDKLIGIAEVKKWLEGFTWVSVIFGNLVTLIGAAFLIGIENSLLVLGAFCASGFFMSLGAIIRYVKAREHGKKVD
jgi:hypothetical protein